MMEYPNPRGKIMMMKPVLSFCLVSVLLSLLLFIFYSLKPFLLQQFSKTCIFLLCNGLMFFIAINSGLNASPPEEENTLMIVERENSLQDTLEQEDFEDKIVTMVEQQVEREGEPNNAIVIVDGHGAVDTEELNKKCEEFIKKMKAAFNSEARDNRWLVPAYGNASSQLLKKIEGVKCNL
ncbi:uncharacterized protein DS421_7g199090 [Arachis hypogaea]|uniref:Uncharacterized protein n=1 Tax=Arachis hypogaea TaxID=3818 RepID=A0A445C2J8_ARAHY|nr:uncharacterized protein LOC112767310 [Arachis hypogaea]QHO26381.1 uncharacterized protein DS421_7g199090 [Arachis hypogaea]RYR45148.1 hypothetical protein Ahy_A07g031006 [Arachis hypogaea]